MNTEPKVCLPVHSSIVCYLLGEQDPEHTRGNYGHWRQRPCQEEELAEGFSRVCCPWPCFPQTSNANTERLAHGRGFCHHGRCDLVMDCLRMAPITGVLQLSISFLFNTHPLLPDGKIQSHALILSSFIDHWQAQECKFQKCQKPHGSIKMGRVTGG